MPMQTAQVPIQQAQMQYMELPMQPRPAQQGQVLMDRVVSTQFLERPMQQQIQYPQQAVLTSMSPYPMAPPASFTGGARLTSPSFLTGGSTGAYSGLHSYSAGHSSLSPGPVEVYSSGNGRYGASAAYY